MIRKNEIILIGTIILIAFTALFILNSKKSDGSKVVITIAGKEYKTLELNKDKEITIQLDDEEFNTIEIKDGMVYMTGASCPDKLCVQHRKIYYNHETIVCLPHKVVLEIMDGETSDVDMISD